MKPTRVGHPRVFNRFPQGMTAEGGVHVAIDEHQLSIMIRVRRRFRVLADLRIAIAVATLDPAQARVNECIEIPIHDPLHVGGFYPGA